MSFDFDDFGVVSDQVGLITQLTQPALEFATRGMETAGGYASSYGGSLYEAASTETALSKGVGAAGNWTGAATGILGVIGGIRDMIDPENHWLGKKGLGLANAISGGIGTVGSFANLAGAQAGFFGGLAGNAGAGATGAAALGSGVATVGSVAGAGLAGIGLGMHGDEAFANIGLVDDPYRKDKDGGSAKKSITDMCADASVSVGDYFGGGDSIGGQIAGNLTAATLAVPGASLAVGSAIAQPFLSMGNATMNAVGHFAD
jgi:hypothetical protein